MAQTFNLTAQLAVQAPRNLGGLKSQIAQQLSGIRVSLAFDIPRDALGQLAGIDRQITSVSKSFSSATASAANFGSTLARIGLGSVGFASAATALLGLGRSFRSAVAEAVGFERAMVSLAQLGAPAREVEGVKASITSLSTSLGVSSRELASTSLLFRQAGVAGKDLSAALAAVSKASLAPSFGDIAQTGRASVGVLQSFGVAAANLEHILDAVATVSTRYAVSGESLLDAAARSGAAFRQAGGSVQEFLAILGAAKSQSGETAETIANSMRMILPRMQRPSTQAALSRVGINLRDERGNFVGPLIGLSRVAAGLEGLPTTSPRYQAVAQELGGTRRVSSLVALLASANEAQRTHNLLTLDGIKVEEQAAQAQGALSVQLSGLRERFLALGRAVIDDQGFKRFASTAIHLADALLRLGDTLRPLVPLLGTLAAVKIGQSIFGGIASGISHVLPTRKFARGGVVPGVGETDSVPALLAPGEFVIRKAAAKAIGYTALHAMNEGGPAARLAYGGEAYGGEAPSFFAKGGRVPPLGATGKLDTAQLLAMLSPKQAAVYAKRMGVIDVAVKEVSRGLDPTGELYNAGSRSLAIAVLKHQGDYAGFKPIRFVKQAVFSKARDLSRRLDFHHLRGDAGTANAEGETRDLFSGLASYRLGTEAAADVASAYEEARRLGHFAKGGKVAPLGQTSKLGTEELIARLSPAAEEASAREEARRLGAQHFARGGTARRVPVHHRFYLMPGGQPASEFLAANAPRLRPDANLGVAADYFDEVLNRPQDAANLRMLWRQGPLELPGSERHGKIPSAADVVRRTLLRAETRLGLPLERVISAVHFRPPEPSVPELQLLPGTPPALTLAAPPFYPVGFQDPFSIRNRFVKHYVGLGLGDALAAGPAGRELTRLARDLTRQTLRGPLPGHNLDLLTAEYVSSRPHGADWTALLGRFREELLPAARNVLGEVGSARIRQRLVERIGYASGGPVRMAAGGIPIINRFQLLPNGRPVGDFLAQHAPSLRRDANLGVAGDFFEEVLNRPADAAMLRSLWRSGGSPLPGSEAGRGAPSAVRATRQALVRTERRTGLPVNKLISSVRFTELPPGHGLIHSELSGGPVPELLLAPPTHPNFSLRNDLIRNRVQLELGLALGRAVHGDESRPARRLADLMNRFGVAYTRLDPRLPDADYPLFGNLFSSYVVGARHGPAETALLSRFGREFLPEARQFFGPAGDSHEEFRRLARLRERLVGAIGYAKGGKAEFRGIPTKTVVNRFVSYARSEQGRAFASFYDKYREALPLEGEARRLFTEIYASQSHGASDKRVLEQAVAVWNRYKETGSKRAEDYADLLRPLGLLGNRTKLLQKVLEGRGVATPKLGVYARTLLEPDFVPPVDRHVISAALGSSAATQQDRRLTAEERQTLTDALKQAARRVKGLTAQGIQAAVFAGHATRGRPRVEETLSVLRHVRLALGGRPPSSSDSVPALLTPGEFVVNREAAQRIGYQRLAQMNALRGYDRGGKVEDVEPFGMMSEEREQQRQRARLLAQRLEGERRAEAAERPPPYDVLPEHYRPEAPPVPRRPLPRPYRLAREFTPPPGREERHRALVERTQAARIAGYQSAPEPVAPSPMPAAAPAREILAALGLARQKEAGSLVLNAEQLLAHELQTRAQAEDQLAKAIKRQILSLDKSTGAAEAEAQARQLAKEAINSNARLLVGKGGAPAGLEELGAQLSVRGLNPTGSRFAGGLRRLTSGLASPAASYGFMTLASFAPSLIGRMAGSVETATGAEAQTRATRGEAVGGAFQGAALGAGVGMAFGPFGVAIGGAVGALTGFTSSLKDAQSRVEKVNIDRVSEKLQHRLNDLASGASPLTGSNLAEAARELTELRAKSRAQGVRAAADSGGDLFGEIDSAFKRNIASVSAGIVGVANRQVEDIAKRSAQNRAATPQSIVGDFRASSFGAEVFSALVQTGHAAKDVERAFRQLAETSLRTARAERAQNRLVAQEGSANFSLRQLAQGVQSAVAGLAALEGKAHLLASAFSGRVEAVAPPPLTADLSRLGAPNSAPFLSALSRVTPLLGDFGRSLQAQGSSANELSRVLPSILDRAYKAGPLLEGRDYTERVAEGLRRNPNISAEHRETVRANLETLLGGKEGQAVLARELGAGTGAFAEKLTAGIRRPVAEALQSIGSALDRRASQTAHNAADIEAARGGIIRERTAGARLQLRQQRHQAEVFAEEMGRPSDALAYLPLSSVQRPFTQRQEALTGLRGEAALNPIVLGAQLNRTLREAESVRQARDKAAPGSEESVKLTTRFQSLQATSARLVESLRHLADGTERNAALQESLNQIETDRQSRLSFGERFLSSDLHGRAELMRGMSLVRIAHAQGSIENFAPQNQRLVLETLNSLGRAKLTGLGGIRANDLRENLVRRFGGGVFDLDKESRAERGRLQEDIGSNLASSVQAQAKLVEFQERVLTERQRLQTEFFGKLGEAHQKFLSDLRSALAAQQLAGAEARVGQLRLRQQEMRPQAEAAATLGRLGINQEALWALQAPANRARLDAYLAAAEEAQDFRRMEQNGSRSVAEHLAKTPLPENLRQVALNEPPAEDIADLGAVLKKAGVREHYAPEVYQEMRRLYVTTPGAMESDHSVKDLLPAAVANVLRQKREEAEGGLAAKRAEVSTGTGMRGPALDRLLSEYVSHADDIRKALDLKEPLDRVRASLDGLAAQLREAEGRRDALKAAAEQQGNPLVQHRAFGGLIASAFKPRGTDTVPAMLTPGEYVVNREAAAKNLPLLERINRGRGPVAVENALPRRVAPSYDTSTRPLYRADGGPVPVGPLGDLDRRAVGEAYQQGRALGLGQVHAAHGRLRDALRGRPRGKDVVAARDAYTKERARFAGPAALDEQGQREYLSRLPAQQQELLHHAARQRQRTNAALESLSLSQLRQLYLHRVRPLAKYQARQVHHLAARLHHFLDTRRAKLLPVEQREALHAQEIQLQRAEPWLKEFVVDPRTLGRGELLGRFRQAQLGPPLPADVGPMLPDTRRVDRMADEARRNIANRQPPLNNVQRNRGVFRAHQRLNPGAFLPPKRMAEGGLVTVGGEPVRPTEKTAAPAWFDAYKTGEDHPEMPEGYRRRLPRPAPRPAQVLGERIVPTRPAVTVGGESLPETPRRAAPVWFDAYREGRDHPEMPEGYRRRLPRPAVAVATQRRPSLSRVTAGGLPVAAGARPQPPAWHEAYKRGEDHPAMPEGYRRRLARAARGAYTLTPGDNPFAPEGRGGYGALLPRAPHPTAADNPYAPRTGPGYEGLRPRAARRFAAGGYVDQGSGTKDDVPAVLTRGEYVLNSRAVSALGRPQLDRLNYFAQGGPVGSAPTPAAATGLDFGKLATTFHGFDGSVSRFASSVNQLAAFGNSLGAFAGNAAALSKAIEAMPHTLTLQGQFSHTVSLNGAEVLGQLTPVLKKMVADALESKLNAVFQKHFPEAGPFA